MRALKKVYPALWITACLVCAGPARGATDLEAQEKFAKARAKLHEKESDHSGHESHPDRSLEFRGIFYGYLPCGDCDGIKTTLSLKQHSNYLLVTQSAKESTREFYEKGKYTWDDKKQIVVLTPKKGGAKARYFRIKDSATLLQLDENGAPAADNSDRYILRRSDAATTREVHIH